MVKITENVRGDKTYLNIKLGDIPQDEAIKLALVYDSPLDTKPRGQIPSSRMFTAMYSEDNKMTERVSFFVPTYMKVGGKYGVKLGEVLVAYGRGDVLEISRTKVIPDGVDEETGEPKRPYNLFNVDKVGTTVIPEVQRNGISTSQDNIPVTDQPEPGDKESSVGGLTRKSEGSPKEIEDIKDLLDKAGYEPDQKNIEFVLENVSDITDKKAITKFLKSQ